MRFRHVLALVILPLLVSCQKKPENSIVDCGALCRHLDSLVFERAADSAMAIVPVALAACSLAQDNSDSLRAVIFDHALSALDQLGQREAMLDWIDRLRRLDSARFGPDHPRAVSADLWLAHWCYSVGDLPRSESVLRRNLAILDPVREDYAKDFLACRTLLTPVCLEQDKMTEAALQVDTSVRMAEELVGAGNVATVLLRRIQAGVLRNQGRFREAQLILEREMERFVARDWRDSTELVAVARSLGDIFQSQGKYAEAEQMYERSLALMEQAPRGQVHLHSGYYALGELLLDQGRYAEAEDFFQRSLELRRVEYGNDHRGVAQVLSLLGVLYVNTERYAEAESALNETLRLYSLAYGDDGMRLSLPLAQLGTLKLATGEVAEAERFMRRAMELRERALDSTHILVAYGQSALAGIEAYRGRFDRAQDHCERALATFQLRYGPIHPATFGALWKLAVLQAKAGRFEASRARFAEMLTHYRDCLRYVFSFTSEANKLCWIRKYPLLDNALLTIALANPSPEWMNLAYDVVLHGKCAVLDAVAAERLNAFCSGDRKVQELVAQRAVVCDAIAPLAMGGFGGGSPGAREDSLRVLFARQDSLDEELSRHCSAYHGLQKESAVEVDDIRTALGDSAVLWDFVRYHPYDLTLTFGQPQPTDSPRYLAFVVGSGGIERMVDLGPADLIDSLATLARRAIDRARGVVYQPEVGMHEEARLRETTGRLYEKVFAAPAETLGRRTTIRICPDGALNLIPIDILPLPDGRYVAEEYTTSYLTSARDLVTSANGVPSPGEVVVFADPDYDCRGADQQFAEGAESGNGGSIAGSDCLTHAFALLPGTRREGEGVGDLFRRQAGWSVQEYYGREASEESFKHLDRSPVILHMATHGYFCSQEGPTGETSLDNPLLRSGLVLAGANARRQGSTGPRSMGDDGILTALEISATDLTNTKLVVLSSCESGLGDVADGEGVFGLRRAFRQANCRSLISAMWAVPDREAADLMAEFYQQWLAGAPKGQALHGAALKQLALSRERYGHGHPALWGALVLIGSPN